MTYDVNSISGQGGGILLSEKLELFLSCRNLPNLDLNSPSDPFIVISQKMNDYNRQKNNNNRNIPRFQEIAKTEVVMDNKNPEFSKQIIIEYKFEEVQILRLDVYDADSKNLNKLSDHDYIGFCEFVLGDLVTANNSKLAMKLKDRKKLRPLSVKSLPVVCIARCEAISKTNDDIIFQFAGSKLPKMDWGFGKIDGYLQIYRQANDGGWMSVHQTEVVKNNFNPVWKPFKISVQRLCNDSYERPILIKCWDWNKNAQPDYAGELQTSLQELTDVQTKVFRQKKKGKITKKKCGNLKILKFEIIQKIGFLQYITAGMQIQLMIAIDFTGSNGDPRESNSLHFCGPPTYESPYMRAIRSVGRVLEPYDSDGQIGAVGFGANINPHGHRQISHCFNLSLNPNVNELKGIEGVLQAYSNCIQRVQLAGPTYFNEIVASAAACAASVPNSNDEQNYVILFIITDGIINDMKKTVDSIVAATMLPLSIIIVGVGNADFSSMDRLDADDEPLRASNGRVMQRDIVQFVPFNKFSNQGIGALAKCVLEEIPAQITGYMSAKKLSPLKNGHRLMKQNTMANMYDGPSSLVRMNTRNNVMYPQLVEQPAPVRNVFANTAAIGKPVNPYYSQQPVQYKQQSVQYQQKPVQYQQQQSVQYQQQQPVQYQQQQPVQYQQQQPVQYQQQQPAYVPVSYVQQQQLQPVHGQQIPNNNIGEQSQHSYNPGSGNFPPPSAPKF